MMEQSTPETMQAVAPKEFGGPDKLKIQDVDVPPLEANEVLIRLQVAGVGEWDPYEREGGGRPLRPGSTLSRQAGFKHQQITIGTGCILRENPCRDTQWRVRRLTNRRRAGISTGCSPEAGKLIASHFVMISERVRSVRPDTKVEFCRGQGL
jgi:hypothetical protein